MLSDVISIRNAIPQLLARNDDDFVDRLNHRHTVALLIVFALVVSTTQYVGEPITCWAPKHFESSHEEFTNSYCWVKNTYYLPWDDHIPRLNEKRYIIPYYQWVPLFLLIQAFMFHIPISIWRNLNHRSGIDVNDVVETAEKYQFAEESEVKRKVLKFLSTQMDRYLMISKKPDDDEETFKCNPKYLFSRICCCVGIAGKQRFGNYLIVLYIFTKFLFVANCIGQLFLLNKFLGTSFSMYGIDVIASFISGDDWTNTERFPRVSMCDFQVRRLGNIHRYTVQCVLPINLFNEKIYLFVWFWLFLICVLTIMNLCKWLVRVILTRERFSYIRHQLKKRSDFDPSSSKDHKYFQYFVRSYLRQDGVLVCRLIGENTNPIILGEFVQALWENFRRNPPKPLRSKLPEDLEAVDDI